MMLAVYLSNIEAFDLRSAAARQRRVLSALMLRNVRTRFFGHGLGYLMYIAWPLSHILIIVAMFVVAGRTAPYGDSVALFIATGAFPFWITIYSLSIIAFWMSAGIFFVPDALPETFRNALAWHPVLQTTEWMRSAYYEGYGGLVLDRSYTISVGLGALFLGLLLERAMRGHLLALK